MVYAILNSVSISSFRSCYFVNFILKNPSLFVMFINCLHDSVSVQMCGMIRLYKLFIFNSVVLCEVLCKLIRVN